jgi:hypothetical protein
MADAFNDDSLAINAELDPVVSDPQAIASCERTPDGPRAAAPVILTFICRLRHA